MSRRLITAEEAADYLSVKKSWLYAEARSDRVPHVRMGRYVRFDLDALQVWWLQRMRGPGRMSPVVAQPLMDLWLFADELTNTADAIAVVPDQAERALRQQARDLRAIVKRLHVNETTNETMPGRVHENTGTQARPG